MVIPASTYRLQFSKNFGFKDAESIVEYLSRLGISHLYASPIFKARKGSEHGYDVVEPTKLNTELGSQNDFDSLIEKIKTNKMGWIQDIVPNHMAFNADNPIIVDVLENGPSSRYFNFFDVEWETGSIKNRGKLLAPFLGNFYQNVLESGELIIRYDQEGFTVNYYDNKYPLSIESYALILSLNLEKLKNKYSYKDPDFLKYLGILYVIKSLSSSGDAEERYNQIKFIKAVLFELTNDNLEFKSFLNENLKIINGVVGQPDSFSLLDEILKRQYFRLSFWKVANEEVNYRRFFNVNDLISIKLEDEEVFNRTHSLILKFVKEGIFDGLRVDHIDGLYNPSAYLSYLCERAKNPYIVVEKILELGEKLPHDWRTEGTTGYDYLNYLNMIFIKPENDKKFEEIYRNFTSLDTGFDEIKTANKKLMVKSRMAGEVERLASLIVDISANDRSGIDFTINGLKEALEYLLIYFPVYRTYIIPGKITRQDISYIDESLEFSLKENPALEKEFKYITDLLKINFPHHFSETQKENSFEFIMKFQQLTGPLMAKGFEDTTLYVFNKFVSLNEVGGSPEQFGMGVNKFHNYIKNRLKNWKHSFNTTSTHDTKRSEDVRARLNVLSEIPSEWENKINYWHSINRVHKTETDGKIFPDNNFEYLIYQSMAGSFPLYNDEVEVYKNRLKQYCIKASREGKVYSSWTNPNMNYENSIQNFIDNIFNKDDQFYNDFLQFVKTIIPFGLYNSLSQSIIKILSPGVTDFYQGNEMWDFSLVDPDNRRSVDYIKHNKLLEEISAQQNQKDELASELLQTKEDGRLKLFTVWSSLKVRNENIELINEGEYIPLKTGGTFKNSIISFSRKLNEKYIIVVVPRLMKSFLNPGQLPIDEVWKDTYIELPFEGNGGTNIFTGEEINSGIKIYAKDLMNKFPVSVVVNK